MITGTFSVQSRETFGTFQDFIGIGVFERWKDDTGWGGSSEVGNWMTIPANIYKAFIYLHFS